MKLSFRAMAVIALTILSVNAYSQSRLNITAGYLKSDNSTSALGIVSLSSHDNGFYVGIGSESPVNSIRDFYIESQILYSYLGDKSGSTSEAFHMLNIPIRAKYKLYLGNQFGIFAYGGPVFSVGLAANETAGSYSYSLYGNDGIMNRFDLKLGVGGGIELGHRLAFRVGYDWGLLNMSRVNNVNMNISLFHAGVAVIL